MKDILKSFTRITPVQVSLPYDDVLYNQLLNEYRLIHLLYHRNINQHRVTRWWSFLDRIHRHLRKILLLMEDIEEVKTLRRLTTIEWKHWKKSFIKKNEVPEPVQKTRKNKSSSNKISKNTTKSQRKTAKIHLHSQLSDSNAINLIEKKKMLLLKEAKYLYKNIIPASYWIFMGVIELGQFINIGFALVGLISKVWSLLSKIEGITLNLKFQNIVEKYIGVTNEEDDSLDFGEAVNIESIEEEVELTSTGDESAKKNDAHAVLEIIENQTVPVTETPVSKTSMLEIGDQNKKKKSKANIMDDIFGGSDDQVKGKTKSKTKKKKKSKNVMDDIFGF